MDQNVSMVLVYLSTLAPWVNYVLMGLGSVVVIGTAIDVMLPDKGAFTTKVMAIPVLGPILTALSKFSPFNSK